MPGERRPAAEEEGADTRLDRKQNYHGAVTGYGIITWCSSWWGRGTLGERAGLTRGAGHLDPRPRPSSQDTPPASLAGLGRRLSSPGRKQNYHCTTTGYGTVTWVAGL